MELEHKTFPSYEFKVLDEEKGIVEAIVSVFNNTDLGGDIVRPGFFDKALQKKMPKAVWMHDATRPIGKTLKTYPLLAGDPRLPEPIKHLGGQYVKGQLNLDVQDGRDALSHLKFGSIDEFSFAYYVAPGGAKYLDNGTRELMSADEWPEWSPVLQGMNPATALISAKSADQAPLDGLRFAEQIQAALDALDDAQLQAKAVLTRATEIKALRATEHKAGRMLSGTNVSALQDMSSTLKDSHVSIEAVFQAIDDLVDSALGEPEDTEPKGMGTARQEQLEREINMALALIDMKFS